MPLVLCENGITCTGVDTPVQNFSSEAPDLFTFDAFFFTFWNPNYPLPPDLGRGTGDLPIFWAQGCDSVCLSLVSQEEANTCAQRQAYLCGQGKRPPGTEPPLFPNRAQICQTICPDGSVFTYTVPAGWFVTTSQSLSDQAANAYACLVANNKLICLSGFPQGCVAEPYAEFSRVSRGTGPFVFSLIGGALPPGMALSQFDDTSMLLSGAPSTAGNYVFTVRARSAAGYQTTRTFTVQILGITNAATITNPTKGTAYSFQFTASGGVPPYVFTVAAGALPDGLTLSSTGLLAGTPTTAGISNFVVQIVDSTTGGANCQTLITLTVQNNAVCPTLLTTVAEGDASPLGFAAYCPATGDIVHPNKVFCGGFISQNFAIMDADTLAVYATVNLPGNVPGSRGACYYPTTPTLYASCIDGTLTNNFIQLVNAKTNALGITLGDATFILYGGNHLRYVPGTNKVYCIGDNGGPAGTDICEIDPTVNSFTRWPCTVNPGAGVETAYDWTYCTANGRIYVGCSAGVVNKFFLRAFNAGTHAQVLATDFAPNAVRALFWVPTVSKLYLAVRNNNTGASQVWVYNVTTDTVEATIDLGTTDVPQEMMEFWTDKGVLMVPTSNNRYWIDVSNNTLLCATAEAGGVFNTGFQSTKFFSQGQGQLNIFVYH